MKPYGGRNRYPERHGHDRRTARLAGQAEVREGLEEAADRVREEAEEESEEESEKRWRAIEAELAEEAVSNAWDEEDFEIEPEPMDEPFPFDVDYDEGPPACVVDPRPYVKDFFDDFAPVDDEDWG